MLSDRKIEKLEREFGANANFLADRGKLDPAVATIAKNLHRYRNGLYHRLQLRKEVLRPATYVYFDVACSVLATWTFQRSWSSEEAYEDLARFGVTQYDLFENDVTNRVASHLRASVGIDLASARTALIDHLEPANPAPVPGHHHILQPRQPTSRSSTGLWITSAALLVDSGLNACCNCGVVKHGPSRI